MGTSGAGSMDDTFEVLEREAHLQARVARRARRADRRARRASPRDPDRPFASNELHGVEREWARRSRRTTRTPVSGPSTTLRRAGFTSPGSASSSCASRRKVASTSLSS